MNIPGYDLKKVIATGGMATVYLAVQKSLGRKVALKVLNEIENSDKSERFLSEGKIIAHLNQRNIITIYDVGIVDSRHYIAMEYLEGGTLADRIKRGLRIEQVVEILGSISSALEYVHGHRIIHRDIKPSNILFHEDGTAKLTDFGIAKLAGEKNEIGPAGRIVGSPYYLSPEQVEGKTLDSRSDLYGLGIVLYEMLTGEKPFAEETPVKTMVARLNNPVPLLPDRLYRYQPLLEKLVTRNPGDRIGTAKEVTSIVNRLKARKRDQRKKRSPLSWLFRPVHLAIPEKIRAASYAAAIFALTLTGVLLNSFNAQSNFGISILELPDTFDISAEVDPAESPQSRSHTSIQRAEVVKAVYQKPENGLDRKVRPEPESPLQQTSRLVLIPSSEDPGENNASSDIGELLVAANRAMEDYRLTRPQGNNAYYFYSRVETIEAENPEAIAGIKSIADTYALLAQHEILEGNYGDALIFMGRGLTVMPDHVALISLKSELEDQGFSDYTATMGSDDMLRLTSMNGGLPVTDISLASIDGNQTRWQNVWQILNSPEGNYSLQLDPDYRAK